MKTPFKILMLSAAILAGSAALVPHSARAAEIPDASAVPKSNLVAVLANEDSLGFCGALGAFKDATLAQISSVRQAIESDKGKNQLLLEQRNADKDAKITDARSGEDQAMASVFASLESQAVTASQKSAVKEFEKAVRDATSARQERVDAALSSYRTGVKAALDLQKSQIDAAVAAYQSAMEKSLSDASANCSSGIASATLRVSLKANLKAAKAQLLGDEKNIDGAKAKIDALLAARRKSIVSADQDFHGSLNAARNQLKINFPN
jgi:hypothetical protein